MQEMDTAASEPLCPQHLLWKHQSKLSFASPFLKNHTTVTLWLHDRLTDWNTSDGSAGATGVVSIPFTTGALKTIVSSDITTSKQVPGQQQEQNRPSQPDAFTHFSTAWAEHGTDSTRLRGAQHICSDVHGAHSSFLPPGLLDAPEAGGEVHRHVLVALLKAVVLADVVQVIAADDDGALHLHLGDHTWGRERREDRKHSVTGSKTCWGPVCDCCRMEALRAQTSSAVFHTWRQGPSIPHFLQPTMPAPPTQQPCCRETPTAPCSRHQQSL